MWNFIKKSFKRELLVSFVAVALLPLVLSCIFLIQMFKVKLERDYQKKDMEQAAVMEEKLTTLFQTIDEVTLHLDVYKRQVAENEHSLTAGPRGPVMMQDVWLMEKLAHFDREVIPERRMHAKGWGAYGTFECTCLLYTSRCV